MVRGYKVVFDGERNELTEAWGESASLPALLRMTPALCRFDSN